MSAGLHFDHYDWSGGRESMLRFGPAGAPTVVVAMPLLEEANRTRAVVVAMLRALAAHGVASILPDLPGQGESLVPTEAATLQGWRDAFAAVVTGCASRSPAIVASIRSGALLDATLTAGARWRWSPQDGMALVKELTRIKQQQTGWDIKIGQHWWLDGTPTSAADKAVVEVAGNRLTADLLSDLTAASLDVDDAIPTRTLRLDGDPRPADRHVPGAPPWRRAEPGRDDELALILAADLANLVHACAAR